MKKDLLILLSILMFLTSVPAAESIENSEILREQSVQNRIDNISAKLMNSNKVPRRIVFTYDKADKKSKLKMDTKLSSRRVVMYDGIYKYTENDDELAAFLAREIVITSKSYNGNFAGGLNSLQIWSSPKKYEIIADKLAVDVMVNAGYDPIGLITLIHKTCPQRRFDAISNKNLTSKRLAIIYEYIYRKYPYYLKNNKYFANEHYQNFLLTSQDNRKRLMRSIKTGSKEKIKYE